MTEQERVEMLLRKRGVVNSDNTINMKAAKKLVTEPWLWTRIKAYSWDKNPISEAISDDLTAEKITADKTINEPVKVSETESIEATEPIVEEPVVAETEDESPEEVYYEEKAVVEEPKTTAKKKSSKK